MGRFRSNEVKQHKDRLRDLGRKEDLQLFFEFVSRLAACHTVERVTAQVEMIKGRWQGVKGFLNQQQ